MTKRKKWGITLLLLPGLLLVLVMLLQVVLRFTLTNTADTGSNASNSSVCGSSASIGCDTAGEPSESSTAKRIVNIISVLIGMVTVIGLFPAIIGGIYLLATPGKAVVDNQPPQPPTLSDPPSTDLQ